MNEQYQYLCCCLPYGVKVDLFGETKELVGLDNSFPPTALVGYDINDCEPVPIEDIKPYLRPMESMTEEEKVEYYSTMDIYTHRLYPNSCDFSEHTEYSWNYKTLDYLNSIHVDYRGLIPKNLAIEAPEGMYEF